MWWFQEGLCALPVALVVWTAATFIFAYITAIILRHVDPFVPYISDTGTVAPERCVFGIMLNVSAFLGVATMYVRYKQVQALMDLEQKRVLQLNSVGLLLGCISSFGMCVVANFQKTTVFSLHMVGAVLTFGVGALYILTQTVLSFSMQPLVHSKSVFWTRLTLCVWTFSSIISMFVSSLIMYSSLPGVDVPKKLHWNPTDPGYAAHLASTVSEWSLAFSFISFFLTYIRDFKKINLRAEVELQSSTLHDSTYYNYPHGPRETSPLLAGSI
ncbi:DNA damage-regulated autophagy modulator protein 2b [Colossoma macropomum]|uniref:DNA damage-regulated autophagy modulator protein 2b n=1 Tax=Colossoma macropomum TaxID=42526 RepID=UPI0018644D31|nr:DNA damage-regulated autophagy modulator protein 2b [Colossoma macropomum]XP_036415867.1 DNA damage-regulated autophagy modulator protein 2b [Colossoma macropomum]XP_036415868.1 DNA damage-regulated autophagy modulator protein 2b [Colossoma macropomum]XP_036415869.1 DNA damage-regulated autophagy modulator protein 2b [Colossoma macropomum]